ncbi:uncharacterized protein LOC114538204 [Dendronephthya gigantea]|uniref:uncharacterized protein LOC114538201 n=1 Tax=Dendronephthya gigantea TaxID=151771 RepID=UPI00106DAA11|nr:uncharacterized protein LOC114538201 [Dendronephthya gigantea]XP_028415155.1 uncharacterized protein LOC114538201 [Dendronephthya gigantea]XP_028415156.1 uncharacterized protein LOC114538204 [Dendronephthya gigantea]
MNNEELPVQNENLRHVINQIKVDMEDLTKQLTQRTTGSITNAGDGVPITEEYVTSLEKEIREVKARNRELTQSMANTNAKTEKTEPTYVLDGSKDNVHIRGLVAQLNSTIGSLRQEKLDLTSQLGNVKQLWFIFNVYFIILEKSCQQGIVGITKK